MALRRLTKHDPLLRSWLKSANCESGTASRTGGHSVGLCVTFHARPLQSFPYVCLQLQFRIALGVSARLWGGSLAAVFQCMQTHTHTHTHTHTWRGGVSCLLRDQDLSDNNCLWIMLKSKQKRQMFVHVLHSPTVMTPAGERREAWHENNEG